MDEDNLYTGLGLQQPNLMKFEDELALKGITPDAYKMMNPEAQKALLTDVGVDSDIIGQYGGNGETSDSMFGDLTGMEAGKLGLGAGQLLLGGLSYLDNKKLGKKKGRLLDQKLAHNAYTMKNTKTRDAELKAQFGKKPVGLGA